MSKRKIEIKTFGGRINIVSAGPPKAVPTLADTSRRREQVAPEPDRAPTTPVATPVGTGITVPASIIEKMEILAEGKFAPHELELEGAYALSGKSRTLPDKLHSLASSFVVEEATPVSVRPLVDEIVDSLKDD